MPSPTLGTTIHTCIYCVCIVLCTDCIYFVVVVIYIYRAEHDSPGRQRSLRRHGQYHQFDVRHSTQP